MFIDKVVIAGVTATSQAVEAATSVGSKFSRDMSSDGVLGMGSRHINEVKPKPQKTFFENIKNSLEEPLFAVQLKHNAPGSFDFGMCPLKVGRLWPTFKATSQSISIIC